MHQCQHIVLRRVVFLRIAHQHHRLFKDRLVPQQHSNPLGVAFRHLKAQLSHITGMHRITPSQRSDLVFLDLVLDLIFPNLGPVKRANLDMYPGVPHGNKLWVVSRIAMHFKGQIHLEDPVGRLMTFFQLFVLAEGRH